MITPIEFFTALGLVLFFLLLRAINKSWDRLCPPPSLENEIHQSDWDKFSNEDKDVKIEIEKLISKRYNNYDGRLIRSLKDFHNTLRKTKGDVWFLDYLKRSELDNPRPVLKLNFKPEEDEK